MGDGRWKMESNIIPLWVDTDSSGLVRTGLDCDDDLAVLVALALHRRGIIDLQGISICGGNAPLSHTWPDIHRLLDHAGSTDITPLKGYGWRSMQVPVKLLSFYNYVMPDVEDSDDASIALINRSRRKSAAPINILMLGPVTNLARALEGGLDTSGVGHIYLMGGEMTGQTLDLNFRSDRAGASNVIAANVPKTIITIQACGQTSITESFLDLLDCPSMAACALLPKMRQQIKLMPKYVNQAVKKRLLVPDQSSRWQASPNLDHGFIPWDIVALLSVTHPEEFGEWEYHRVTIQPCLEGEPCNETMHIAENLGSNFNSQNWSGVVRTPHLVRNETKLLEMMFSFMGEIPAASPQPPLFWGFYSTLASFGIVTIIFFWCFFRWSR
ncbi:hypothetical protein ACHAXR_009019 [Thalassiosira sp. AJA248-18]